MNNNPTSETTRIVLFKLQHMKQVFQSRNCQRQTDKQGGRPCDLPGDRIHSQLLSRVPSRNDRMTAFTNPGLSR